MQDETSAIARLPSEIELRRELARRNREIELLRTLIRALQKKAKADQIANQIQAAQANGGGK